MAMSRKYRACIKRQLKGKRGKIGPRMKRAAKACRRYTKGYKRKK